MNDKKVIIQNLREAKELRVFWLIHLYAYCGKIKIDKEVTLWSKIECSESKSVWQRVLKQVTPLQYEIMYRDPTDSQIKKSDCLNKHLFIQEDCIKFEGGFLKVIDPGLIDALDNWQITMEDGQSLSEFVMSQSDQFVTECDGQDEENSLKEDPNNCLKKALSGTFEKDILGDIFGLLEKVIDKFNLGEDTFRQLLNLIVGINRQVEEEVCGQETTLYTGENIRIDAIVEVKEETQIHPILFFPQNDFFSGQVLKSERDVRAFGRFFIEQVQNLAECLASGDFTRCLELLDELKIKWAEYRRSKAASNQMLGTVLLQERLEGDEHHLDWSISNLDYVTDPPASQAEKHTPFLIDGIHKVTVNQDRDSDFDLDKDLSYFEASIDAVPLSLSLILETPPVEHKNQILNQNKTLDGHLFGNGKREFYFGFNPDTNQLFNGVMKDVKFDPSSGCPGCFN